MDQLQTQHVQLQVGLRYVEHGQNTVSNGCSTNKITCSCCMHVF